MRRSAVNRDQGLSREALLGLLASVAVVVVLAVVLLRPEKKTGSGEGGAEKKKPASRPEGVDLVVTIGTDGKILLDGRPIARPVGPDDMSLLMAALQERAAQKMTSREPPVSGLRVMIDAAPETKYRYVQQVMVCCMRAYIWDLRFGDVPVSLPKGEWPQPILRSVRPTWDGPVVEVDLPEIVEHPVFIHEVEASAEPPPAVSVTKPRPVTRRSGPPDEIRIKLWLSSPGRVHISVDEYLCRDINDLALKLAAFRASDPNQAVIIDSRQRVPFRYVLGAIKACRRAGIKNVLFQAPPVPGGGGEEWWYE